MVAKVADDNDAITLNACMQFKQRGCLDVFRDMLQEYNFRIFPKNVIHILNIIRVAWIMEAIIPS